MQNTAMFKLQTCNLWNLLKVKKCDFTEEGVIAQPKERGATDEKHPPLTTSSGYLIVWNFLCVLSMSSTFKKQL